MREYGNWWGLREAKNVKFIASPSEAHSHEYMSKFNLNKGKCNRFKLHFIPSHMWRAAEQKRGKVYSALHATCEKLSREHNSNTSWEQGLLTLHRKWDIWFEMRKWVPLKNCGISWIKSQAFRVSQGSGNRIIMNVAERVCDAVTDWGEMILEKKCTIMQWMSAVGECRDK